MSGRTPLLQILIVDDEPLIRRLLSTIVQRLGAEPHAVATAAAAIEAVHHVSPPIDVAILDRTLRNQECGGQLAGQLKAIRHDLPIILMSGCDIAELGDFPVDAYLQKPFDKTKLRQTLADLGLLD